jgi:hypothetical protein
MGVIKYLEEKQREIEETDYFTFEDLSSLPTWAQLVTGKKKVPSASKILEIERGRLERKLREGGRHVSEQAIRGMLARILGQKYGERAYRNFYDINAYRVIRDAVGKYFTGQAGMYFVPIEDELRYKGKKVFGCHQNGTAFYTNNPERDLGGHYKNLVEKSGLEKERFDQAFKEYVKIHEFAEATYMNKTLQNELNEEEHGKLQAYLLKSIKYSGAKEIYKVAVLVDSLRRDEYGQNIRKYADPDIKVDLHRLSAGYDWANAA